MNIDINLGYKKPDLRELNVTIDGEFWFNGFMSGFSGYVCNLEIKGDYLQVAIDPPPQESEVLGLRQRVAELEVMLRGAKE